VVYVKVIALTSTFYVTDMLNVISELCGVIQR
jgi:hypothetical protein